MHPALPNSIKDGIQPVIFVACIDARAIVGSFAQRLAYRVVKLLIRTVLDTRNNIHRLEDVQHPIPTIDDGDAADIVVDHQVNDVENRAVHVGRSEIRIATKANIADRLFEQHSVVFVVDGDELEDTVLSNDGNNHLPACFTVDIDERYTAGASLEHSTTSFVEGA